MPARENASYALVRLNMDEAVVPESLNERAVGIGGDMDKTIRDICSMNNQAERQGVESIAFCCLSTGIFMFPNERAAQIAVRTVKKHYEETQSRMKVIFNVFKDEDFLIYSNIIPFSFSSETVPQ